MGISVSRHQGASPQVAGPTGAPASAASGSLLSAHASRSTQQFEPAGNQPAAEAGASAGPANTEEAHERQLGQEVNHVRSTTPTQGNPLLAGSLGSGSLMGSFVSTPL